MLKKIFKKKKPKQKKIVGGMELYGHTYMLIVGCGSSTSVQTSNSKCKKNYTHSSP